MLYNNIHGLPISIDINKHLRIQLLFTVSKLYSFNSTFNFKTTDSFNIKFIGFCFYFNLVLLTSNLYLPQTTACFKLNLALAKVV